MKVPISWLREFVDIKADPAEVAQILTLAGHEVEEIFDPYQNLGEIVTVKILEIFKTEDLQEVVVCKVTDGKDTFEVLTTAKEQVRPGLIVALAKPGSLTFDHAKIEVKTVKGYRSEGMFLSPFEAGVSPEKDRLLTFSEEVELGLSIYKILNISEPVLDIAITPNRGDLLSVWGIARELNLITDWELRPPVFPEDLKEGEPFLGKIEIWDSASCFRYIGRLFKGITVKESPFEIRRRLFLVGQRPINNIVDITNYVLLELGQPLHAFDWAKIAGGHVIIRKAKRGETLLLLDGNRRTLSEEDLVIADKEKALVLAGIMGGEESGVTENTWDVFLESAWFNPKSIRLTGQRHRITTESSYRFERGVDPNGVFLAVLRATDLIVRFAEPKEISQIVDVYPQPYVPNPIELPVKKVSKVIGFDIGEERVESTLKKLGNLVREGDTFKLIPHSFRQDLRIPEDLIEEIARLYGYDQIPSKMPFGELTSRAPQREFVLKDKIKEILTGLGFYEVITYSFINPEYLSKLSLAPEDRRLIPLKLSNPISSSLSVLRTSLVPGLLEVAKFNSHREVEDLKIFEIGKVFFPQSELAEEREALGLMLKGHPHEGAPWEGKRRQFDLYDLKGFIEALFSLLRLSVEIKPFSKEPFLKKGLSFDLYIGETRIGYAGEIKRVILEELDLKGPILIAELDLELVSQAKSQQSEDIVIKKPPKFPSTFRDITFIISKVVTYAEIKAFIDSLEVPFLERVELFALYEGEPIPPGEKSLSLRFWYRGEERTLTDEEVEELHRRVAKELFEKFGARPR